VALRLLVQETGRFFSSSSFPDAADHGGHRMMLDDSRGVESCGCLASRFRNKSRAEHGNITGFSLEDCISIFLIRSALREKLSSLARVAHHLHFTQFLMFFLRTHIVGLRYYLEVYELFKQDEANIEVVEIMWLLFFISII
jgi:hypothetical protein